MSGFTAGPWSWGHNGASSDLVHCIDVSGRERVGQVAYLQSYTNEGYDDREETLANARLIAAAPELLAMVQQYASECAHCGGTGVIQRTVVISGCEDERDDDCPDCADIRALIAKAKGEGK